MSLAIFFITLFAPLIQNIICFLAWGLNRQHFWFIIQGDKGKKGNYNQGIYLKQPRRPKSKPKELSWEGDVERTTTPDDLLAKIWMQPFKARENN